LKVDKVCHPDPPIGGEGSIHEMTLLKALKDRGLKALKR